MLSEQKKTLVSADEEQDIGRKLLIFLSGCPSIPASAGRLNFEFLPESPGIMLSSIQAAFKTRQYITGGYEAQYQFKLVYRTYPNDNDSRLSADETLNEIGVWAERNVSAIDLAPAVVRSLLRTSNASLYAVYEDGSRDHQILMNLTYEVI